MLPFSAIGLTPPAKRFRPFGPVLGTLRRNNDATASDFRGLLEKPPAGCHAHAGCFGVGMWRRACPRILPRGHGTH